MEIAKEKYYMSDIYGNTISSNHELSAGYRESLDFVGKLVLNPFPRSIAPLS